MSHVRIWVHAVWGTKNKLQYLSCPVKHEVFGHIRYNANEKGIYLSEIGGFHQHVHCLLSLTADQNIGKIMQLLKGESSYWINRKKVVAGRFEWADEYYAVSVSESHVERVRKYIRNQEEHHRTKTWEEEVNEFMEKYGFTRVPD